MDTKELYEKINEILYKYSDSLSIACEVARFISDDVKPAFVIRVLLETMRIRRSRVQAAREKARIEQDLLNADLLERILLDERK